jgi:hypothetical protein
MSTEINLGGGGGGVGVQGIQGIQGVQGLNGAFAGQGIQGIQGTQGLQGTIGTQGATGIQGTIGNIGSQGIQGITGTQGLQGVQGTNGLQGTTGNQGIQGATGVTGNTGAQGVQGITGIQGANGIQGSVGLQGTQGIIGAQGIEGIQGATGIQGSLGNQGTQGLQGAQGTTGNQGATGIQGDFGIQGVQGFQGTIGIQGNNGIQGIQGSTGGTGNTGAQGIQGTTGSQGIQGLLGIQGIVGGTGPTGLPGSQGVQGVQGIQGLPGDPGVVGYYYGAYDTSTQTAGATSTEVIILFSNSYGSNSVTYTAGSFRINEAAVYKIQCEVNWRNADTTNTATGALYAKINGTAVVGTTTLQTVGPLTSESTMIEITQAFNAGDTIQFAFTVDDTDLALRFAAASSPLPSGASAIANIAQVARTLGPLDGNIQLAWTTGYVNLTNGVDNTIPFNSNVFSYGAALSASNLSTANAGVQFLYTGLYIVNVRAHLYDLGSNMILSTTLYTGTNGTTWAFSTTTGINRYEGTNTNQIQNTSFLIRVTSLPFYIQPRLQPSANSPFPADLGAPTAFSITRVGDL